MLSQKPWRQDAVLLLLAFIFLGFCIGGILIWVVEKIGPALETDKRFLRFVVSTISFQGLGLAYVYGFLKWHGIGWRDFLGLGPREWKHVIGWIAVAAAIAIPGTMFLNGFIVWLVSQAQKTPDIQPVLVVVRESGGAWQRACLAVATLGIAPLFEEAVFRGILYPAIKQSGFPRTALLGTSVAFGVMHLTLVTLIPLTVLGLILAALYEKTDVLLAPVVVHALFNAVNLFMLFAASGKPIFTP